MITGIGGMMTATMITGMMTSGKSCDEFGVYILYSYELLFE